MPVPETPESRSGDLPHDLYRHVAELWLHMRRFAHASEQAARRHGLTPQRYRLLLMIRGAPAGAESATIGELAERLRSAQSSVTELVARTEAAGLVERTLDEDDNRRTEVRLTEEGRRRLAATVGDLAVDRRQFAALVAELRDAL